MSCDEYDLHSGKLDKYYSAGTWHGQSAAGAVYILATLLERVDNEFLW
jgi:cell division control protein 45